MNFKLYELYTYFLIKILETTYSLCYTKFVIFLTIEYVTMHKTVIFVVIYFHLILA